MKKEELRSGAGGDDNHSNSNGSIVTVLYGILMIVDCCLGTAFILQT